MKKFIFSLIFALTVNVAFAATPAHVGSIPQVPSIADLKALNPGQYPNVDVLCYYATGCTIAQGVYTWNAADATADNGGTIIQPNAGGVGRWNLIFTDARIIVTKFGCYGDNSHNDAPCIQSAINYARTLNHGTIVFPNAAGYLVQSALDVTATSSIRFVGEAGNNTSYALIYADHTGHVFDLSGSSNLIFEHISIRAVTANHPKTGWFMARNAVKDNAGNHSFIDCVTYGTFSVASVYSYGSESNEYRFVNFVNRQSGGKSVIITGFNVSALSSTFITIATGAVSNISTYFFGGSLFANSTGNSDALYLEATSLVKVYATELFSSNGIAGGRSLVYIDTTNSASSFLTFDAITGENFGGAGNPAYGWYIGGGTQTILGLSIVRSRVASVTNTVFGDNNTTFDGPYINDLSEIGTSPNSSWYYVKNGWIRGSSHIFRHQVDFTSLWGAVSAFTMPGLKTGTVIYDILSGTGVGLTADQNTVETSGTVTPTDCSGASLVFAGTPLVKWKRIGNVIWYSFQVNYPATADGSNSCIALGAMPNSPNTGPDNVAGALQTNGATALNGIISQNTNHVIPTIAATGIAATNAQLSGLFLRGSGFYFTN